MRKETLIQFAPFLSFIAGITTLVLVMPATKNPTFANKNIVKMVNPDFEAHASAPGSPDRYTAVLSAVAPKLPTRPKTAPESTLTRPSVAAVQIVPRLDASPGSANPTRHFAPENQLADTIRPQRTTASAPDGTNRALSFLTAFDAAPTVSEIAPPVANQFTASPVPPQLPQHLPSPRVASRRTAPADGLPTARSWPLMGKVHVSLGELNSGWPYPQRLKEQLDRLAPDFACYDWGIRVWVQVKRLQQIERLASPECAAVFRQLDSLAQEADKLARQLPSPDQADDVWRAKTALERRLATWRQIHEIAKCDLLESPVTIQPATDLRRHLAAVEQTLKSVRDIEGWRKYLLLDVAYEILDDEKATEAMRREMAWRMLQRLESPALTEAQLAFFQQPAYRALNSELRRWASAPVEYSRLLRELESYESDGYTSAGVLVADSRQALRWASNSRMEELADQISTHYRDANFRVAISGELMNRMLPPPQTYEQEVDDNVLGADVQGTSTARNRLFIRLLPDRAKLRVGIEAHGDGTSETTAEKGPVIFGNRGRFRYLARKLLLVDRRGVSVWRSDAEAHTENEVTGVASDFDRIPILGALIRSIALNKREDDECRAQWESNRKLKSEVTARLDEGVHRRLDNVEQNFDAKVLEPLRRLGVQPVPIDMQTTEARAIVRYRLAGFSQLGANTPRPYAKSDSLLSVQIHQSAINNVIHKLDLGGKTYKLPELYREVADKLGGTHWPAPTELPDNAVVRLTDRDPVQVRFAGGKAQVTMNIAKLQVGRRLRWSNFSISVNYVPDDRTLDAKFIRVPDPEANDAFVMVDGIRRTTHRMLIAGIFEKLFSVERPISVFPRKFISDERLSDVHISQFEVEDGWVAIALAPSRKPYIADHEAHNTRPASVTTQPGR